jgi:hypothetical protein
MGEEETMKKGSHHSPESLARMAETNRKPEVRALRSETKIKMWAVPGFKERNTRAIKNSVSGPEVRKRTSEGVLRGLAKPGVLERRAASRAHTVDAPR